MSTETTPFFNDVLAVGEKLASVAQPPALVVFYSSEGPLPECFSPMLRSPEPPTNIPFLNGFPSEYERLQRMLPSLHDGAILVAVDDLANSHVSHWSCRLFPPDTSFAKEANRGSSYYSGVEFSHVKNVLAVMVISNGRAELFSKGQRLARHNLEASS